MCNVTKSSVGPVNLVALVDWRFINFYKRQPGERDIPRSPIQPNTSQHTEDTLENLEFFNARARVLELSRIDRDDRRGAVGDLMQILGGPSRRESSIPTHSCPLLVSTGCLK